MCGTVREDTGLAAAGTGNDHHGTVNGFDRVPLHGIEFFEE
jgi:hypothetical protein